MKPLLLTFLILLILSSCSKHEDHETVNPYDDVKAKAASYLEQMKGLDDETLFFDRCDRLTFLSLGSAFIGNRWNIGDYEWSSGEWHRNINSCYPDDSRSEISFDGLIGVLHHAWTYQDKNLVNRLVKYGELHDWVMGDGDREITYIPQIKIITSDMLTHFNMLETRPSYSLSDGTHNENLLVLSAWLKLRYAGYIEGHELLILKNLRKTPLGTALLARINDGDQSESIKYLSGFPDKLPLNTGWEQWGGASQWLYFFLIYGILEGK